jgi:thymidine kinase
MCGNLEIIIGPMFSGKSTEIIRRIRLLQKIDKKILIVKPSIDNRYTSDKITSHNFESVDCIVVNNLCDINNSIIKEHDTVVIDEGQFFDDLVETVDTWLKLYNINIIVAGLDGDFQQKPIGKILNLIPLSNKCVKLNSLCNICKDGTEAPFSFRIVQSNEAVLVGGSDSYMPLCRTHYNLLSKNSEKCTNEQELNI